MAFSMEVAIKAITLGWTPEDFDSSGNQTVLDELKELAPHFLTSDTYKKLKEHNRQVERLQATILLSQDPFGCLLGTEDPDLELIFIDEIHHAVSRHLDHHRSRLLRYLDHAVTNAGVGIAVQSMCADVDGIKRSIFMLRLQRVECLRKFEKVLKAFNTRSLSLPELDGAEHLLFCKLEKAIDMYIYFAELFEMEYYFTFGDDHKTGRGMQIVIPEMQNDFLHQLLEAQRKLKQKEALLEQFEKIWSPRVESMIKEYHSKLQELRVLRLANNLE
ncbi:uncharacterized protein [Dermacentor andersoni]|uniref:uncharacterized protein isoform X2 n=1 Tax=Dermacentor andersoni TaxID=34620 RepID=UPI002415F4D8|nr:uncharacterized protein LOC126545621 isoform X2 [Dermacentor andersoni]